VWLFFFKVVLSPDFRRGFRTARMFFVVIHLVNPTCQHFWTHFLHNTSDGCLDLRHLFMPYDCHSLTLRGRTWGPSREAILPPTHEVQTRCLPEFWVWATPPPVSCRVGAGLTVCRVIVTTDWGGSPVPLCPPPLGPKRRSRGC